MGAVQNEQRMSRRTTNANIDPYYTELYVM